MNRKKMIIAAAALVVVVLVVSGALWKMSKGTLKISLNVAADTLRITDSDKEVIALHTGVNETELSSIPSGTYLIEIMAKGYLTAKKEIKIGWMTTVSENFTLQPDTNAGMSDAEEAGAILTGKWKGRFGKSEMTLVIEEVSPGSVAGYDQVDGKKLKLSGTYRNNPVQLELTLNEPGDTTTNGQFLLTVKKPGTTAEGQWESFDKTMKYAVRFEKDKSTSPVAPEGNQEVKTQTQSAQPEVQLRIIRATYGFGGSTYDVTRQLNNKVRNNNIYVEVSNATFGDPAPGKPKQLIVSYEYKGRVYNKTIREKGIFRVP